MPSSTRHKYVLSLVMEGLEAVFNHLKFLKYKSTKYPLSRVKGKKIPSTAGI